MIEVGRDYSVEAYLETRKGGLHRWLHNLRVKHAVESVRRSDGVILDLGASTCESTAMISAARPGSRVIALERSLQQLQKGRNGVHKVCADARKLPFPIESCSAAILISTFKHIYFPDRLLDELQRVLVPGGTLTIIEPSWWILKLGGKLGYFDPKNIANIWKPSEYRERLTGQNFDVSDAGYFSAGVYQRMVATKL